MVELFIIEPSKVSEIVANLLTSRNEQKQIFETRISTAKKTKLKGQYARIRSHTASLPMKYRFFTHCALLVSYGRTAVYRGRPGWWMGELLGGWVVGWRGVWVGVCYTAVQQWVGGLLGCWIWVVGALVYGFSRLVRPSLTGPAAYP